MGIAQLSIVTPRMNLIIKDRILILVDIERLISESGMALINTFNF